MKNYTEEEKEMINGVLRSYTEDYWRSGGNYMRVASNECVEHFQEANGLTPNPKLEVGKWYKSEMGSLFSPKNNLVTGYGFTYYDGSWRDDIHINKGHTPATNEEVETALTKEAERRGLVEGVSISRNRFEVNKCKDKIEQSQCEDSIGFHSWRHNTFFYGKTQIFDNGIWAELIKTTKMSVAQLEAAHGYTNLEITK